ncbi:peroxiredoxin-like family protein [Alteromonas ponticola]|uniref:thioredoxin-dependent peroxiredoxin n=1 Tax=Alteromonas ponticola TaxID=2720613 RepID=A0ABX1R073_9ALTE|nr:peroxiredoxin-like family protein [Alteromonas ponticola]NMH59864.1 AhpC/TSA family protein [Alteromonas ponticola]
MIQSLRLALASALVIFSTSLLADIPEFAPQEDQVRPLLNGMTVPDLTVKDAEGSPFSLKALFMQKPSVVLFYRGGWCPYCNRQLAGLKDIEAELIELGYQVLAISPQSAAQLQEQKFDANQAVTLLTDENLEAISGFGVGFVLDNETVAKYKGYDITLTENAQGQAVLPAPSLFFVDKQGVVQLSYVNPDYKVRPSAGLVLAMAKALTGQQAAQN